MIEIIVIASFFIIIAALLYLIYLGNKNNPMSISATEDIMKINNVTEMECKSKLIPYQLCPKCNGDGNLLRYNTPAMISTYSNVMCDVCNGDKIIKMYYENI